MLTIESKKRKPETWHLGSETAFSTAKTEDVTALAADGDELKLILSQFEGIPRTKMDSQVWVGDFARQIFANLTSVIAAQQQPKGKKRVAVGPME